MEAVKLSRIVILFLTMVTGVAIGLLISSYAQWNLYISALVISLSAASAAIMATNTIVNANNIARVARTVEQIKFIEKLSFESNQKNTFVPIFQTIRSNLKKYLI